MNISLFKEKNFTFLMTGKFISLMGTEMQDFALSLYVLRLTGSALKFASVLAVTVIPQLLLGPIAGVLADWFDRKKTVIVLDLISGILVSATVFVYSFYGSLSLGYIYFLAIALSIISLLFNPAINTIMPTILKKEELLKGNSISSLIMSIASFLSPIFAGILFSFFGLFVLLILNALSFFFSSVCESWLKLPKTNKLPEKLSFSSFIKDFSEGITLIKTDTLLMSIILMALVTNFIIAPLTSTGLIFISKEIIKISDTQMGILQSIAIAAMMCAPLLCGKISKKLSLGKIIFLCILTMSLQIVLMCLPPSVFFLALFTSNFFPYLLLIIFLFMMILTATIANISLSTMFQQKVALEMMGRVSSVMNTCCTAAVPLGQLIFGILMDRIDAWIIILGAGILLFVFTLFMKKPLYNDASVHEAIIEGF